MTRKMEERNYYKLKKRETGMNGGVKVSKRGQIAIFVIIAIVIIAVILVIMLYPKIKIITGGTPSPEEFLKSCIVNDVKSSVDLLAKQGGYANPEGFYVYNDQKIKFLCYTNEYYKTCVVQQPMIETHFEQEMDRILEPKARDCLTKLKQEYESRGYSITGNFIDAKTGIEQGKIKVIFNSPLTVTKASTERFNDFEIGIDSKMSDLLAIAQSIVEFESVYGDSETTAYIKYYPDLRIEKIKLSEGTKIYKLSDVITKEEFVFASRSLSWPPGYGVSQ